ncbi:Sec61beta family protein [Sulfolobus islandicus Y.G.57.14]|jgi:preprotein translocase subunit Sec61beta|uniref:Preprotein translocase subunit SecG n=12 Tax=Saccharolobus TaxID=2100760 RepID=A0A8F5C436_9CREN|nr:MULTISPECIES: preprotein translocase subunit Sec61beta [Sulfolobaceae]ACP35984.1 Sec61beta family protein [Sulfolobus islandicus L.S.2.15]ACP38624.1 Sec61beta family protein [Sulfolobus islandicus M.14.25]ACP46212.1 Sec61beta family protein [Sulfolobus islandicus Y.G.57.14]ACP48073.1 Sec61beta family protein [Sulfolobus islandicus Y.N.15.51]ACP55828.1 Sec61beta family protein [Sulfolobus islandicus M.16.27]
MPSSKKKKETVPVMSMAGLIRYYEEENEKIKINPKIVIGASLALTIIVIVITKLF